MQCPQRASFSRLQIKNSTFSPDMTDCGKDTEVGWCFGNIVCIHTALFTIIMLFTQHGFQARLLLTNCD